MAQTLTELFESKGSNSATWQNQDIMALVELPVGPGDRVRIRRLGSSMVRAQALKMAVDKGAITVGSYSGPSVALWSHTAPPDLFVEIDGPATALQLWNAWSLDGVDNSWLGNAAMMVDEHGGGLTLQCSDGVGDPDFSDLVVWVAVERSNAPTESRSAEDEGRSPGSEDEGAEGDGSTPSGTSATTVPGSTGASQRTNDTPDDNSGDASATSDARTPSEGDASNNDASTPEESS